MRYNSQAKPTKPQLQALYRLYLRDLTVASCYRAFRRRAFVSTLMGCVLVPWHNMIIGIEPDGHTHS